jgi:hypothetical protein
MAQQFSQPIADPFTEDAISSSPLLSPPRTLTHSPSRLLYPPPLADIARPSSPHLYKHPDQNIIGKVIVFSTYDNTLSFVTLDPIITLRIALMLTPGDVLQSMKIGVFQGTVDLKEAGVRVGEGAVHGLVKELPLEVMLMRVLGWYKVLYVVRWKEDVVGPMGEEIV